jgi:ubiquitin carboxyl-terminal hydrolase L3
VPNTPLSRLLAKSIPLSPNERAKVIEECEELEVAHKSAASLGDTPVPDADKDVDLHYVCFVKSQTNNHLYELDGRRKGPLDRGDIGETGDVLSKEATSVIQKFLDREKETGRLEFSLVALVPNFD